MGFDLLAHNLLSPIILAFALGVVARLLKSDLEFPPALSQTLSLFLLLAIGLKGGEALNGTHPAQIILPIVGTIALGVAIPLWSYWIARRAGGLSSPDAAALAAHYGSTSAVTFLAALSFLDQAKSPYEGFMPGLLALMEVPAIVVALLLVKRTDGKHVPLLPTLHHVLASKSILLLLGGMVIGFCADRQGMQSTAAFFVAPFKGVLCLFLLELGMVAASRLGELKGRVIFLALYGTLLPIAHGTLGALVGTWCGLSPGGATVMGVLAASASYIAAPAAVRLAIPEANPAYPLTGALGITFPFNLAFGIPLYHFIANAVAKTA